MSQQIINIKGKEVSFDSVLASNLNHLIDMVKAKFDGVLVIDGMEGSGKSELGKQICLYVDPKFSDKRVIYESEQFYEVLEESPPDSAILWDEFVLAGLSTEALTKMQEDLIKKFTLIRKKNLFIVLVIPYIFLLRKYFAMGRTRCLVHVYSRGKNRGYFKFYDYDKKKWIYNYGHKTWLYSPKVTPNFTGTFKCWSEEFLDEAKIEAKKEQATKNISSELAFKPKKHQINVLCDALVNRLDTPNPYSKKGEGGHYARMNELIAMAREHLASKDK